ncbi:hypothetical protein JQM83_14010 [Parabacteroides distasonis]|nr:hypothetical protein [Parabacteroides distasonis]
MLNILTRHNQALVSHVAQSWYDDFLRFMTTEQDKGHEYRLIHNNHAIRFTKLFDKIEHIIHNQADYSVLSEPQRGEIDAILRDLVFKPELYVLADEARIKELVSLQEENWKYVVTIFKSVLVNLYQEFTKNEEVSYKHLTKLDIRTCPYCNRNYIVTMKRKRDKSFKTRAEFDHFYEKSNYPLLALSFYNLVPSCHICNHGKLVAKAGVNPYFRGFSSSLAISAYEQDILKDQNSFRKLNVNDILHLKGKDKFSLAFPSATADEKINISTFGLAELYNEHKDYVMELIDKANAYNDIGVQNLYDAFQGIGRSPQDVYDFVWGKSLTDTDLYNRPLSKLTKDVLEQIGIKR